MQKLDLQDAETGYVYLSVAEDSPLTIQRLKETVQKTQFRFVDVQWR